MAVSSVDSAGVASALGHLTGVTGATVATSRSDACDVVEASWLNQWEHAFGGSQGEHVYMKYVHNRAHQTIGPSPVATSATASAASAASPTATTSDGKTLVTTLVTTAASLASSSATLTVADYEAYVGRVHARYLATPLDQDSSKRWRSWDHWLDQHVGVKYVGASRSGSVAGSALTADGLQATCLAMAGEVNDALLKSKAWVSKRTIQHDGDHYYTGYPDSAMAVEYNTECHYGQEGATDICTCVPENSDNWAMEHDSVKFSSCAVIYEEADGHPDTSGPWDMATADAPADDAAAAEGVAPGPSESRAAAQWGGSVSSAK